MTEARAETVGGYARPRTVQVTAVVVTRGHTEYLEPTLAALAAQTRAPQQVLVIDAGASAPEADLAELLAARWSAGPPDPERAAVLATPDARTFGDAVRSGLAQAPSVTAAGEPSPGAGHDARGWLWLLHDDSAPEPTALAELLRAVEIAPSVAIAGCKQQSWADPVRVLEVGLTTSRFGRRMTGLDEPEVDQGQHDGREDVLAVGLAGALVRRDVWDALGGPDPALGPYGDGLDLSRRARLAGHRVVVVPRAVVRHAQASLAVPVGGATVDRPGWDARRSSQARREAFVHAQLVGVPAALVPLVAVVAVVSSVARALGRFVTKEPHLVVAELLAPWAVLARPARLLRARRTAATTRRMARRSLRPLQVTWREVVGVARDRSLAAAERRRIRQAPSELELAELAALRSRRRVGLATVLVLAAALSIAVLGPVLTQVAGGARLTGGTLAYGDAGLGEVWSTVTSGWVAAGLGEPGPTDPILVALAPLIAVTGSVGGAVAVLLLGSIVLAALGAWFAAGAATRSIGLRAWATLVWVGAPALLLGLGQVRLGGVLAHAALPWVVLGVARGLGVARVDAVESGLVGALREGHQVSVPVRTTVVRTAEASLAAAAGAGLALALVTAAAPVLLPFGLVALAAVAVTVSRRRRLAWVVLPSLAVQGPMIAEAVGTWSRGGWRLLVADPGLPLVGQGAPGWQQLLGWPVTPPPWIDLPDPVAAVAPFVATGVVVAVAVLALLVAGRAGRAVRAGWLVAACGLAAAVVAARVEVGVADGVLATAWSGPGVSLALAGLLTAALVGATGLRATMAGHTFGWRQVCAGSVGLLAVLGPLLTLAAWTWDARVGDGLAMTTSELPVVPAVGGQMQSSPDDSRVLELETDLDGQVRATLLRRDGIQLTDLSRATAVRDVTGAYGDATAAVADAAETEVADLAARLTSGADADVVVRLARLGVGAVLVPPVGTGPGAQDEAARSAVVGRLDSTAGLERATETESGVIWRVAAGDLGSTVAWARLVSAGSAEDGLLGPIAAQDGRIDTDVPAGDGQRLVILAERSDAGWRATLDGRPLRAVETGWQQAFEIGPAGGHLVVAHSVPGRTPWLALQGAVMLVTVLLALPVRRRRGGQR
ncbi:glycosyltransferase [Cellulomonas sp. KRMCY2]|uniref:glycosyltransferase n=1 Tax=Cellulomonas sp. KRMCY2 TaxID=1304865 RepID=UPI00045E94CD|nr:glycosyltransferase [Cellulomonas sp. KRMCY2]